jgi:hypothetical protein
VLTRSFLQVQDAAPEVRRARVPCGLHHAGEVIQSIGDARGGSARCRRRLRSPPPRARGGRAAAGAAVPCRAPCVATPRGPAWGSRSSPARPPIRARC